MNKNPFVGTTLTKQGGRLEEALTKIFHQTFKQLEEVMPSGREADQAKARLQEAYAWAVQSVTTTKAFQRKPEGDAQSPADAGPVADLPKPEEPLEQNNNEESTEGRSDV